MDHSFKVNGNQVRVVLSGKMYAHDARVVRSEVLERIDQGATDIVVDLTGLSYVDSAGLGVLVTIHKLMEEKNGRLVLTGVQGMVGQLLSRTRLDKVLTIE